MECSKIIPGFWTSAYEILVIDVDIWNISIHVNGQKMNGNNKTYFENLCDLIPFSSLQQIRDMTEWRYHNEVKEFAMESLFVSNNTTRRQILL